MKNGIYNVVRRVPMDIMIALKTNKSSKKYINTLAKELNITPTYTSTTIRRLERIELVIATLSSKNKFVYLTKKGHELTDILIRIRELLD